MDELVFKANKRALYEEMRRVRGTRSTAVS